jgi:hypothetical protein
MKQGSEMAKSLCVSRAKAICRVHPQHDDRGPSEACGLLAERLRDPAVRVIVLDKPPICERFSFRHEPVI